MRWRVTVRHFSDVDKRTLDTLEEALAEARRRGAEILGESRLGTVSAFRDFTPDKRVQARIEISGKRALRGPEAGFDIMGDGTIVPYRGAIVKRPMEAVSLDEAIERLREALDR